MGEVYRARDPRLGCEVAVKVLPAQVASDSERLARFEREARAVTALNHPNILTVYDVGTSPAVDSGAAAAASAIPYVVTELLQGETLRELASHRAPSQRKVLGFAMQIAQGLDAAHAKGRQAGDSGEATKSPPTGAGQVVGTVGPPRRARASSATGWKLDVGPFPGWKDVPVW